MIYLISGLAANQKAFAKISLQGRPFTFLPWIEPLRNESFESYLDRFSKPINSNEEIILIGTSFGGIVSQELAKRFNVKKIILISSIVSEKEFSPLIHLFRITRFYKVFPIKLLLWLRPILYHYLGGTTPEEKRRLIEIIDVKDTYLIRWSINTAINWKQPKTPPENLYRIHGTKDLIFPVKYIGKAHLIKNGTHLMIIKNALAVNHWLNDVLNK